MFKKIIVKKTKTIRGVVTIHCVWCGAEVPCVGQVPTKCPMCGNPL
ncbi:MAG: hypothetical protein K5769_02760 [Pseudobutyrivibrio sp.]|nr:hypothetical protein [Pseudobutyrivibrio sp.]